MKEADKRNKNKGTLRLILRNSGRVYLPPVYKVTTNEICNEPSDWHYQHTTQVFEEEIHDIHNPHFVRWFANSK